MSIISANDLALVLGAHTVLEGGRLQIAPRDHIGLVGPNGSGKTSLLRLIAGAETPTRGTVTRAQSLRLAYVSQRPQFTGSRSVYEVATEHFAPLLALEEELLRAGEAVAQAAPGSREASERYERLSRRFEHEGGYTYAAEARQVLQGLSIGRELWLQPASTLSGGEQARVALASAILQRPDLLLLDEPTNHLDLQGLAWLEHLLAGWLGAFVVVSHDRFFLDQITSQTWEIAGAHLAVYRGNFSAFVRQRDERARRQAQLHQEQERFIERQQELIRRYGAGQRAKWAKGLAKRLARVERIEAPPEADGLQLRLRGAARGGRIALSLEDVVVANPGTGEALLRLPPRLQLERGARADLLGPNGCGKTTLLRTIAGDLPPSAGRIGRGHGIVYAFHRQGLDDLDDAASVLEEFLADCDCSSQEARDLLARFLFRGEDVDKRIGLLSGGERSRLALAKLAASGANLLILDEPTNHLDIVARQALEAVLLQYKGTILFVSHDRRFIDTLATELWIAEDGQVRRFEGNYSAFLASSPEPQPRKAAARVPGARPARPRAAAAQIARFEQTAAELDARLTEIRREIEAASALSDAKEIGRLGELYVETEEALNAALAAWDQASLPSLQ